MNAKPMNAHAKLAELYCELASTHRRIAAEAGESYCDQHSSPLGPRLHCRLINTGALPGFRVGRRLLAKHVDIDAYIERHRIVPTEPTLATTDRDSEILQMLARVGAKVA